MKVAIIGATGLVGSKMLRVLAERNFPVTELIPVASESSVGKVVEFKDDKLHSFRPAVPLHLIGHRNLLRQALRLLITPVPGVWIRIKN